MEIILRPNGRPVADEVRSYAVELPNRGLAVIDRIDGKGWQLTVRLSAGVIEYRGMFSTANDAVAVLEAEYSAQSS